VESYLHFAARGSRTLSPGRQVFRRILMILRSDAR
jgi:hypothetical protein